MFRPCSFTELFSFSNHSLKRMPVIQALRLARYVTGSATLSIPLKHRGFADLLIRSGFNFSPQHGHVLFWHLDAFAGIAMNNHWPLRQGTVIQAGFICVVDVCWKITSSHLRQTHRPLSDNVLWHLGCLATQCRPLDTVSLLRYLQPAVGRVVVARHCHSKHHGFLLKHNCKHTEFIDGCK